MAITKYNPGDARLGASLGCFGFSALAYLKPEMVKPFLVHRRFTMFSSLAFGLSYLYSSTLYTRGLKLESHKLAALNGTVATSACVFNGMARRSPLWYALSILPLYLTVEDMLLLSNAWKENKVVFQMHKAPNDVQRAHVATQSGPSPDMPREEKFVQRPKKLSSYEAATHNAPVTAKDRRENKPDLVSGAVNSTPIETQEVVVEKVPVSSERMDRL
eukprot:CAMPEP_0117451258 /NCGR_PEP_ID=MMETSP0759-20121206/8911_1 /TAXON_ID=63605 /ORGANISM="Percolomonas cosmopolitus, Strain WS" /LENGTH=216 /DNA_ID=CAMNT_0005243845 /DNA_START=146 /DNA_END=796 /DNA_ORIENTATION=-